MGYYPMLSMDKAYNCKCQNNYAHNKCLININKCPTCRKEKINIIKLKWYMMCCLVSLLVFLVLCAFNQNKIVIPKTKLSLFISIAIGIIFYISLFIFTTFNDYLIKYWLCNEKN